MRFQPIAAAVLLAPLAIATGAGAAPAGCVPAGLGTLRASGAARIFSQGSTLYGCLGARTTRLGSLRGTTPFPATRVALYALSPRYAGVDTVEMGVDTLSSTVKLVDLQTGRTTATAAATTPERRAESFVSVTAIALSATARSPGSASAAPSAPSRRSMRSTRSAPPGAGCWPAPRTSSRAHCACTATR